MDRPVDRDDAADGWNSVDRRAGCAAARMRPQASRKAPLTAKSFLAVNGAKRRSASSAAAEPHCRKSDPSTPALLKNCALGDCLLE